MDKDDFKVKTTCYYAIITGEKDPNFITDLLGIIPTEIKYKDKYFGNKTGRIYTRPHSSWKYQLEPVISDEIDVEKTMNHFKSLFMDKLKIIDTIINENGFECAFSIDIETEDAGAGYDLDRDDILFISKIATRFSCHVLVRDEII